MINKKDYARKVSEITGFTLKDVEKVINGERSVIIEGLKNQETIKPFEGYNIIGEYVEAHEAVNPRTGEKIVTPGKIKIRSAFTRYFKEEVNS